MKRLGIALILATFLVGCTAEKAKDKAKDKDGKAAPAAPADGKEKAK